VGARKFLIAYNINLLSTKEQAHRIALNIREQGRAKDEVRSQGLLSPARFVKRRGVLEWTASASASAAATYKCAYISEDTRHRLLKLKI
jgi:polyribonucleotide nucleotidyltransferase